MLDEEILIAEAPEDTDAGEAGVVGGLDVYVAVAYVDDIFLSYI